MKQKKKKGWMLKLDKDDPEKELDFEVRSCMAFTTEERFKRMLTRSLQIAKMMKEHGHKKTPLIVQHT